MKHPPLHKETCSPSHHYAQKDEATVGRFEALMVMKIQVKVFWNSGILPQHYIVSQPVRPQLEATVVS